MFDVVALGESLIDFTPNGTNAQGIELFARNPGGAPANVLAMNARLGGKTAFIGKVGKDGFGDFLRQTLVESSIDVSGLVIDEKILTTLAFVQLDTLLYLLPEPRCRCDADFGRSQQESDRRCCHLPFRLCLSDRRPEPHRHVGSCAVCTAAGQAGQL